MALKRFETVQDVDQALTGSYFYYRGKPCWVQGSAGKDRILIYQWPDASFDHEGVFRLREGKEFEISVNSEDFDIGQHRIGYINIGQGDFNQGAVFLYRQPHRQYKRGLYPRTTSMKVSTSGAIPGFRGDLRSETLRTPIVAMMNNQYPSWNFVRGELSTVIHRYREYENRYKPSWALSLDMAIGIWDRDDIRILWRDHHIGFYDYDSGTFTLLPEYDNSNFIGPLIFLGLTHAEPNYDMD